MSAATALPPIHRRLRRRNRVVRVLRLAVPMLGVLVLAALLLQIALSSLGGRFSIGQITVTPEEIVVDAPEYAGLLEDGAAFRVWAETARAALNRTDTILLNDAQVTLDRVTGVQLRAASPFAELDTANQITTVPGTADVFDSNGMTGTLEDTIIEWNRQILTSRGAVSVDQADGTTVRAQGLVYDAANSTWTFSNSVVTMSYGSDSEADTAGGE